MTEKLRFLRLGSVFSVNFERVSLLHMPTHYPGPVYCNTNSVTQLAVRSSRTIIGGHSRHWVFFLRFGRVVLFTHIHLLFYYVVFLHNQRRHPGVISLLTTTIMSLSLNILSCYQTNLIVCDA